MLPRKSWPTMSWHDIKRSDRDAVALLMFSRLSPLPDQVGDKIGEAKMLTSFGEANSAKEGKAKARRTSGSYLMLQWPGFL